MFINNILVCSLLLNYMGKILIKFYNIIKKLCISGNYTQYEEYYTGIIT